MVLTSILSLVLNPKEIYYIQELQTDLFMFLKLLQAISSKKFLSKTQALPNNTGLFLRWSLSIDQLSPEYN
jgi:hypothetical protein